MEGSSSNGGLLYHEVQESKLCALHCVNTVLQGQFFSEMDFAALASDLDHRERQMMLEAGGDFLPDQSHNVSLDGNFSIQVLQKALEVWDLQVIPLDSPDAEHAQTNPELETAFICNLQSHWFCIRKVNGEWYNFNSLYAAPEHLSKFYLSAYLGSLKGEGWSIFLVRGNFPSEFLISSSDASFGHGQWLTPEDAERILKSSNSTQRAVPRNSQQPPVNDDTWLQFGDGGFRFGEDDDEDLKAAIAASLKDSGPPVKKIKFQDGASDASTNKDEQASTNKDEQASTNKDEQESANKNEQENTNKDDLENQSSSPNENKKSVES